jgi:hypothetical protein
LSANTSSSPSNQNDLLVPIIFILLPVIKNAAIEVRGDCADESQVEQELNAREGRRMQNGEVGSFLGVLGCEYEGKNERRVQSRLLDCSSDWISSET